jgi:hypothetical protein
LLATIWYERGTPIVPFTSDALVMTGGPAPIVITSVADPVPVAFVALIVTLKAPVVLGVPETRPVEGLTVSPGGRPVALKLVGLLVAVIW